MKMWRKFLILSTLMISACVSQQFTPLRHWTGFVDEIEQLNEFGLMNKRDQLVTSYNEHANDDIRLRLAYVLSRTSPSTQNLNRSHELLNEIAENSAYAAIKIMLQKEIELASKLQAVHIELEETQTRLETFKTLSKSSELLAEIKMDKIYAPLQDMVQREMDLIKKLQAVRRKFDELQSRLEVLKSIDGDLTDSQKKIDEISQ